MICALARYTPCPKEGRKMVRIVQNSCCKERNTGFLPVSLSSEVCAGLGNGCERFCMSRSLLGS